MCENAVERLDTFLERCGEKEHHPDTLKKRTVLVKKRFLYPFRRDTLEDLQKQLSRLLENVQTIIQVLGL